MKKLITSAVAALALLFGFASCSGDLHDAVSPNAMKGNWFYYELDTSTATSETISIIFNNGSAQTEDVTGVSKTGTVEYMWAVPADGSKVTAIKNTRTDCPDKGIGNSTDKLGIYVFTNSSTVNLWAWDGDTNFTGGTWPGVSMTTDAEIKTEKVTVSLTFKVTGANEGDRLYINGTPWSWGGDWPFDGWNGKDKDEAAAAEKTNACLLLTDRFATANDSGVATFNPLNLEIEKSDSEKTYEIKVVSIKGEDPRKYEAGMDYSPNGSFAITPNKDASYTVTIDVSGGSYNCSVE